MCKNMASQYCAASLNIENAVGMGNYNKIPLIRTKPQTKAVTFNFNNYIGDFTTNLVK